MSNLATHRYSTLLTCAALLVQSSCDGKSATPAQGPRLIARADVVEHGEKWEVGPRIDSREELEDWIRGLQREPSGQHRRVRMAVRISFDEKRLEISSASIGTSRSVSSGIEVVLDDSALGIPLIEKLRHRCPAPQLTCIVWIEGHWGPLIEPGQSARRVTPPYTFAVLGVLEPIRSGATNVLQSAER